MSAQPFLEARLDDAISFGMSRTKDSPGRTMRYGPTGSLSQNFVAAYPIHRYDLAPGIQFAEQFLQTEALWYVVFHGSQGPYKGFLLKDWGDYQLSQDGERASRLTLIAGAVYQINRVHTVTYGPVTDEFLRPIYKPETGISVFRKRAGVVSSASATIDLTNGQATISGHVSGDTYTCEGTYNVPVTFSENTWTAEMEGAEDHMVAVSGQIKLEEIRL